MAIDTGSPRTRRAILGAAIGAAAATVAQAVGRPLAVRAAGDDGLPILLGGLYANVQSQTTIANKATNAAVLYVASNPDLGHGSGTAIQGYSAHSVGVLGTSDTYYGMYATSTSGTGIGAESGSGNGITGQSDTKWGVAGSSIEDSGVLGTSAAADAAAIAGLSSGNSTGVLGYSGPNIPPVPAKTGVYGYAAQDAGSRGVHGHSPTGRGVYGQSVTGTAVYAATTDPAKGTSLRATGRVRFDRCAGVATIASGTKSVTVTPGFDLVTTAAVVATLQGSAGGTTTVHRCSLNPTANTFTIYLTANSTTSVKVAWHVFG